MSLFHESLQRLLSGATLSGFVTALGDGEPVPREAAALIERVAKSDGLHEWQLDVVVTPGGNGRKCAVKCDVRWAESTPLLTISNADIPGLGTVHAKLMIHDCLFAGTWVHGDKCGHVWGAVASQYEPKPRQRFVIERSSEFLREWWTGSDWSKDSTHARWYEHEPDGPGISKDEGAHAVYYPRGEVEAG